ncbi:26069_t:CDS:2, partial [Gigaspora margarita]
MYGNQNESEKGDFLLKRSETTHLIVQELPKLPTPHRKRNDIVNSALIEIDPNKASGKSNIEINPMQENKIIVPAKQTLANHNHNTEEKGIVTGSNTIKIINKRNFSSSEDNRDINLQKVISGRTRREFLKEQDRETTRESVKSTITLLTGTPVVYESVNEPVGSSSKVPSVDTNRKGLLQKELTLKIGCHNINRLKTNQQKFKTLGQWLDDEVFDIFAVTETNLNKKEGFFVEKKVENFKFFWSDISIDKRKSL